jgi:hypothetical protein
MFASHQSEVRCDLQVKSYARFDARHFHKTESVVEMDLGPTSLQVSTETTHRTFAAAADKMALSFFAIAI